MSSLLEGGYLTPSSILLSHLSSIKIIIIFSRHTSLSLITFQVPCLSKVVSRFYFFFLVQPMFLSNQLFFPPPVQIFLMSLDHQDS